MLLLCIENSPQCQQLTSWISQNISNILFGMIFQQNCYCNEKMSIINIDICFQHQAYKNFVGELSWYMTSRQLTVSKFCWLQQEKKRKIIAQDELISVIGTKLFFDSGLFQVTVIIGLDHLVHSNKGLLQGLKTKIKHMCQ